MSTVREKLIEATFEEVFTKGYKAASLANILNRAEVKKGAMYHYFSSKKEMVLAMIKEQQQKRIEKKWQPLIDEENDTILVLTSILQDTKSWDLTNGCAFGNLMQESFDQDEDFALVLEEILLAWKNLFITSLNKAQENNQLNKNTNIEQCATFIIATLEGAILLSKKSKDTKNYEDCMAQLTVYLNSLRK